MNPHKTKCNNQVEIQDLIDDAVNNALVRRSEALLPLDDEEATNILGGTKLLPPIVQGVIINPNPNPKPYANPCPTPYPIIHGLIINPNPIIHGLIINPNPEI